MPLTREIMYMHCTCDVHALKLSALSDKPLNICRKLPFTIRQALPP